MIPILNSSAGGWVNGIGNECGFERLYTGQFFVLLYVPTWVYNVFTFLCSQFFLMQKKKKKKKELSHEKKKKKVRKVNGNA